MAGSSASTSGWYHSTKSWTMPCSIAPGFSSTHAMTRGAKIALKPTMMRTPRSAIEPAIQHEQEERLDPAPAAHRSLALLAQLTDAGVAALLVLASGRGASGSFGLLVTGARRVAAGIEILLQDHAGGGRVELSAPASDACRPRATAPRPACHELRRSSS